MKTSPQLFQIENEETVWHTHKLLQETEKDIQLMKYRLKLLKRGDAELSKRIDQTKKKTKSMIELKMNHHEQTQQKKLSQKNIEGQIKIKLYTQKIIRRIIRNDQKSYGVNKI